MNTKPALPPAPSATRNSKVPRPRYFTAAAMLTAASSRRFRSASLSATLGANSMIFWWLRWMLHSRSHTWLAAPVPSPTICTSTWRALATNSSAYTAPLPKAAFASDWQRWYNFATSSALRTTRMPRPPPPAIALMTMAPLLPSLPSEARNAAASSGLSSACVLRDTGTPQLLARATARALSPNSSSVSASGPMKTMPSSWQRRANAAFSLRNP